jgi:site-specific DNA-cytosine methylase
MACVLGALSQLGFAVSWLLIDATWFGVPQSRERLFLIATSSAISPLPELREANLLLPGITSRASHALAQLIESHRIQTRVRCEGDIGELENRLRPAIGKARPNGKYPFGPIGMCSRGQYTSYDITVPSKELDTQLLGNVVAPAFYAKQTIRSVRFWTTESGRGPTKMWLRQEPISHCIGTSLGGAPLFAVPVKTIRSETDKEAFLEFANWHREQDEFLVMRLQPAQAVRLFGPHTEAISGAVLRWDAGDTRKYKVVGNMVAPIVAKVVAETLGTLAGLNVEPESSGAGGTVSGESEKRSRTVRSAAHGATR